MVAFKLVLNCLLAMIARQLLKVDFLLNPCLH